MTEDLFTVYLGSRGGKRVALENKLLRDHSHIPETRLRRQLRQAWEEARPAATLKRQAIALRDCERCEGMFHSGWVRGEGPVPAPILFLGESPGRNEAQHHRPFIGPAGGLLNELLELAGWPRTGVFITNVVKCFTFRPKVQLTPRVAQGCWPYLREELRCVDPAYIVCLGRYAWENWTGEPHTGLLEDLRQQVHRVTRPGLRTFSTVFCYHPAAALRQPQRYLQPLREDFAWLGETAGPWVDYRMLSEESE